MNEPLELAPNHAEHGWPGHPHAKAVKLMKEYGISKTDSYVLFGCREETLDRWLLPGSRRNVKTRLANRIEDAAVAVQILGEGFAVDEIPEVLKHRFEQIGDRTLSECIGTDRFGEVREFACGLAATRSRRLRD